MSAIKQNRRSTLRHISSKWTERKTFLVAEVTVIFTEKSKFDVSVGDARRRVIRNNTETYHWDCLKRTVKFLASVMVFGCMSPKGVGNLRPQSN